MFNWISEWWAGADKQQHLVAEEFDEQAYKQYTIDRHAHSDLVRWDVFRCYPFVFKFRYVVDDSTGRCCSVVDFCKGLEISHDLLLECSFDRHHVKSLNELVLGVTRTDDNSLGSLFATKHGLILILQQLPFVNKEDVLMAIKTDKGYDRDDTRDKIEAVLKHVKALTDNSDKFINAHKSFKQEVSARFGQFEQRLDALDTRISALHANVQAAPGVVFPRDVTKHPHLAVFMSVKDVGNTQIAFARGQEEHFRKRKLEFEDDMDVAFEGVHPNPTMAVHCIREEFVNSGYKIRRLSKKVMEVKCTMNVAKDIIKRAILSKN